jgi:GWxTD domain-containing protein
MRRPALYSALFAASLAAGTGCGSWKRVGSGEPGGTSEESITQLFNAEAYYRKLGRLATGQPLPFVGSIAFAAGSGDSTLAIVGLSLENRSLGFQREGNGFVARYRVDMMLKPDGGEAIGVSRDELVRVATFQETQRADESVLFQQVFKVRPGRYHLTTTLRDPATGSTTSAESDVEAPAFRRGSTSAPIIAYQVRGRAELDDTLSLVLNPRGAVAYGGDSLLAYVEGYGFTGPTRVPIEVRTEADSVLYSDSLTFRGGQAVESQVLKLRPDSLALGALTVSVGQGTTRREVTALVSFSAAWVVTNYDQMLDLLRYFGNDRLLDSIRNAPAADRPALWRLFWRETDPDKSTSENEAINTYFTRLVIANQRFRDEGVAGWRTDRGEVFIALGEPDESFETTPGQVGGRLLRWNYINQRLAVVFQDETGFGRSRMTPGSRSEFERVVARLRRLGG